MRLHLGTDQPARQVSSSSRMLDNSEPARVVHIYSNAIFTKWLIIIVKIFKINSIFTLISYAFILIYYKVLYCTVYDVKRFHYHHDTANFPIP